MKILFLMLFALPTWATVHVAFIEVKGPDGKIIQFEPNGRFAHMAISYKGLWLHSYPPKGVSLVTTAELQKIGALTIIPLKSVPNLSPSLVSKFLGKAFDYEFSWDENKIYCAELVAKLLGIKPTPMNFSAPIWPKNYKKYHGLPGISPDDIYQVLLRP